jgi:hypothetical protein
MGATTGRHCFGFQPLLNQRLRNGDESAMLSDRRNQKNIAIVDNGSSLFNFLYRGECRSFAPGTLVVAIN